jgi:hypothetical protein
MFIYNLSLYTIKIIHCGIFNFIVFVPFFSKDKILLWNHANLVMSIIVHWFFNDNMCCLTMIEHYIRKIINKNAIVSESFSYRIISPIYKFDNNYKKFTIFSYIAMLTLLGISISKLLLNY